jgi:oligoribonuclease
MGANSNAETPKHLAWVDLEMTGLDVSVHRIVEVAILITDFEFNEIARYEAIIYQPEDVLARSSQFCIDTHERNGLYEAVRSSKLSEQQVEAVIADLLQTHILKGSVYLAGNSIRMDRMFIDAYWPAVASQLHYRMLDVSSFKLLWLGQGKAPYVKGESHRALEDIKESIVELKHYTSQISEE